MIESKYKKYLQFFVCAKHWKMISTENIFLKNDFLENILRRKSCYTKTNKT
jgi:hypothetical protein